MLCWPVDSVAETKQLAGHKTRSNDDGLCLKMMPGQQSQHIQTHALTLPALQVRKFSAFDDADVDVLASCPKKAGSTEGAPAAAVLATGNTTYPTPRGSTADMHSISSNSSSRDLGSADMAARLADQTAKAGQQASAHKLITEMLGTAGASSAPASDAAAVKDQACVPAPAAAQPPLPCNKPTAKASIVPSSVGPSTSSSAPVIPTSGSTAITITPATTATLAARGSTPATGALVSGEAQAGGAKRKSTGGRTCCCVRVGPFARECAMHHSPACCTSWLAAMVVMMAGAQQQRTQR